MLKKKFNLLSILFLLLLGFLYRIYGLNNNYSFWTDENHVAIFVRAILERGNPILNNGYSTGVYQLLQYWLSAVSSIFFGLNEFTVRSPSIIFGILTIWGVYLLGKELFNRNVGLLSAFLISFLKIEILWSRQARPYQALQFFFVLGAWFVYKLTKEEKFNWRYFPGFLACGILASLMHGLGLVVFFIGFLYLLLFRFSWLKKWILLTILMALIFGYFFKDLIFSVFSNFGDVNNLFYYRVFLLHNYPLLVLLSFIGFLFLFLQKRNSWQIPVLFLGVHGAIVSFFLDQPFTRYFYPVFPFLILLSAFSLLEIPQYFSSFFKRSKYLVFIIQYMTFFALIFLFINFGHKFTFFPKQTFSLNEDMQEVPEVNWKKVYGFVDEKLKKDSDAILISNWNDLPVWYLGEGELDYLLRKNDSISKDALSGSKFIPNLVELKKIINKDKKGLIVIDSWDDRVPDGIRGYIERNLKKELEVDRLYSVQPRYWLVEVYSWGF